MKVFKFGGASVKSAEGVRNLYKIVRSQNEKLIIVVSAMGKITNALEEVLTSFFNRKPDLEANIQAVIDYHEGIVTDLFSDRTVIDAQLNLLYGELREITKQKPSLSYDYEYDRIVSFGEFISTIIVAAYIKSQGEKAEFVDIRTSLKTSRRWRSG